MCYVNGDSMFSFGGYDEEGDSGRLKCWPDNIYFKAQFKESLIEEKTFSSKKRDAWTKEITSREPPSVQKRPILFGDVKCCEQSTNLLYIYKILRLIFIFIYFI